MKRTIILLLIIVATLSLSGCSQKELEKQEGTVETETAKAESASEQTVSEITYPKELDEEEITEFFDEMKGSWHSFNPPVDEYDMNFLALVFYPKNNPLVFYDRIVGYEYNDLMIYGCWMDMPDYRIDKMVQINENTWNADLDYVEKEYFPPDICSSLSITKVDSDKIIVIMQKEDVEESTYPIYGKEYTFNKISDGYEVSESYYWQWVKENGYKSIYTQ